MTKDYYIGLISNLSDRYGDQLLLLIDEYGCCNLQQLTLEQVKSYYERISKNEQ